MAFRRSMQTAPADRSCSQAGTRACGSVRLTTTTIVGAWVNARAMIAANLSRCAGAIAPFSSW